jgi:hypothetical protein
MNYGTTIPLPLEYNWGLIHLNLFKPPSSIISNRVCPQGPHRIRYYRIHCYLSRRLPIHRYGGLFFINSSMALSRILRHHELQTKDVMSKLVTLSRGNPCRVRLNPRRVRLNTGCLISGNLIWVGLSRVTLSD